MDERYWLMIVVCLFAVVSIQFIMLLRAQMKIRGLKDEINAATSFIAYTLKKSVKQIKLALGDLTKSELTKWKLLVGSFRFKLNRIFLQPLPARPGFVQNDIVHDLTINQPNADDAAVNPGQNEAIIEVNPTDSSIQPAANDSVNCYDTADNTYEEIVNLSTSNESASYTQSSKV